MWSWPTFWPEPHDPARCLYCSLFPQNTRSSTRTPHVSREVDHAVTWGQMDKCVLLLMDTPSSLVPLHISFYIQQATFSLAPPLYPSCQDWGTPLSIDPTSNTPQVSNISLLLKATFLFEGKELYFTVGLLTVNLRNRPHVDVKPSQRVLSKPTSMGGWVQTQDTFLQDRHWTQSLLNRIAVVQDGCRFNKYCCIYLYSLFSTEVHNHFF